MKQPLNTSNSLNPFNTSVQTHKERVHFTDTALLNATNPIKVHLIGAGGTGSQVATALARINHALVALGHAGLSVTLWDNDLVTPANLGRQLFSACELGMYKSTALISRINRFFGTDWRAQTQLFSTETFSSEEETMRGSIYLSCVDSAKARFDIGEVLTYLERAHHYHNNPKYWLDFGNSTHSGQVILGTLQAIEQPHSDTFTPIDTLPTITQAFGELLTQAEQNDNTPSCSLAEALTKQDLFINATLSQMGSTLLWNLFREGLTPYRGFFLNLKDFRTQPLAV